MAKTFFQEKGVGYETDIPDVSQYSGEANDKYINDEKKMFTLTSFEEIKDRSLVKKNLIAKNNFIVAVIKKDDRVLLNNLELGKLYIRLIYLR